MIAPSGKLPHRPLVTRHFESTRLQARSIASAYETLIPVLSRPINRTRDGHGDRGETRLRFGTRRSVTGGA